MASPPAMLSGIGGTIPGMYAEAEKIIFLFLPKAISRKRYWKYSFSSRHSDRKKSSPNLNMSFWYKFARLALTFGLFSGSRKKGRKLSSSARVVLAPAWTVIPLSCDIAYALHWLWPVRRLPPLSDRYSICNFSLYLCTASSIADFCRFELFVYTFLNILWDLSYKPPRRNSFPPTCLIPSTKWSRRCYFCVPIPKGWYAPK